MLTVVSGLGRCGSSMVMNMLINGGMRATHYAVTQFREDYRTTWFPNRGDWVKEYGQGYVLKILNPHVRPPPNDLKCRWIWLDRDKNEIRKSWKKAIKDGRFLDGARQNTKISNWKNEYRKAGLRRIVDIGGPLMRLSFEWIILHPYVAAVKLAEFTQESLDLEAMASTVFKRSPKCQPTMLEFERYAIKKRERDPSA